MPSQWLRVSFRLQNDSVDEFAADLVARVRWANLVMMEGVPEVLDVGVLW